MKLLSLTVIAAVFFGILLSSTINAQNSSVTASLSNKDSDITKVVQCMDSAIFWMKEYDSVPTLEMRLKMTMSEIDNAKSILKDIQAVYMEYDYCNDTAFEFNKYEYYTYFNVLENKIKYIKDDALEDAYNMLVKSCDDINDQLKGEINNNSKEELNKHDIYPYTIFSEEDAKKIDKCAQDLKMYVSTLKSLTEYAEHCEMVK